jgi:hypothetical protein
MPRTPGTAATAASAAALAACILSAVSLIRVGSSAVVPKRRCAATMAAMPSRVGVSLNKTSPPPLTWTSIKPGASQAPFGTCSTDKLPGKSLAGTRALILLRSMMTAWSRCRAAPSKTVSAATAYRPAPFIVCG